MTGFKFFLKELFVKRWLVMLCTLLLFLASNYIAFFALRSALYSQQGYAFTKGLAVKGTYIANVLLDQEEQFAYHDQSTLYSLTNDNLTQFYHSLSSDHAYGMLVDDIAPINMNEQLSTPIGVTPNLCYLNQGMYSCMRQLQSNQGDNLSFDYVYGKQSIPVVIGPGLSSNYPIGSQMKISGMTESGKELDLKVVGVLSPNVGVPLFLSLNTQSLFNYTILVPVTSELLDDAVLDIPVNGLFQLALFNTDQTSADTVAKRLTALTGEHYVFETQHDNYDFFLDYWGYSLTFALAISMVIYIVLEICVIWNYLIFVRLSICILTIQMLVGLTYKKLRSYLFATLMLLGAISLVILAAFLSFQNFMNINADRTSEVVIGFLGLTSMDFAAIACMLVLDLIVAIVAVAIAMRKIKRIPISMGVLQ